jgi:regulatory protein
MQARAGRPRRTLKQRAIALLARREYARAELAQRLVTTGAERSEVDAVLDELCAAGLVSDARFASALVHRKARDFSRHAIAQALREKGVPADDANEALAELDGAGELARAQALWYRRFGRPAADEREKARQLRFLLSRGYSHAIAFRVLKQAGRDANDR